MEKQDQIDAVARIQEAMLKRWEKLLTDGELSPTESSTLTRFLMANGWTVDPSRVPKNLRDMLTAKSNPDDVDDDDVLMFKRA